MIPSFLAPQGVGDPAAAIGALPGERPSARPRFPRRGVGHGHWSCSPSPEGGLPGGWGADARCCGMMRNAGRAVVRPRSPQSPPAPCGSAEELRSPGGVRVSDPPVLARSRTRESRRCPAVRLPPGGGGNTVWGGHGGGPSGSGRVGRGMPAGFGWRRHGNGAAREQWLSSSCAIKQRLALSEQPAVIRADLQVGVKRARKTS